jgi:GNAT superfamily N-acetyltransferase
MRIATPADIPALTGLINLAYRAEAFCIAGDRTRDAEVGELMGAGTFLVMPDTGPLQGSVFLRPEGACRWYLGLLSVAPALQGRGLGRTLVEAAESFCRDAGGKFLDLTVVSARKELFGFYGRLGFAANDVLPFRAPEKLLAPCHLVRFTKALIPPGEL